jgi:hypothetical protein
MALVERVKNILLTTKTEWPVIANESATVSSLYTGYIMILAAIGPIVAAVTVGVGVALVSYVISLAMLYVMALIVDALAPTFGGEKNFVRALQLLAYALTAAWIAGVFRLIPVIGDLVSLAASIYSIYTFYLGASVMGKCARDKAGVYTLVVVLCGFAISAVIAFVLFGIVGGGTMMVSQGAVPGSA